MDDAGRTTCQEYVAAEIPARLRTASLLLSAPAPTRSLPPLTRWPASSVGPAASVPRSPGTSMPVVVTSHRTTRVLCGTDGVAALMSVGGTSVDGEIVLIRRTSIDPVTGLDRLQLLTGNGGPVTDTSFQGPVLSRLCGRTGCGCSSPGRPGPQPPRLWPWPYT